MLLYHELLMSLIIIFMIISHGCIVIGYQCCGQHGLDCRALCCFPWSSWLSTGIKRLSALILVLIDIACFKVL